MATKAILLNTKNHGKVSRTKIANLVKEHGSYTKAAAAIGVSRSTLQAWESKLKSMAAAAV